VFAALALSALGVYAIDAGMNPDPSGVELAGEAERQLIYLGVGIVAAGAVTLPHYRRVLRWAMPAMAASVALLVFLLLPGVPSSIVRPINGARSWITLPKLNLQPSELAKIAFVLVVARHLRYRTEHRRFLGLLPPALIAFVPIGLIMLQPDLGTATLFVPALFAMLVAAGARLRHLTIVVLIAALAAPAAYPMLKPHQKQRIAALAGQIRGEREGEQTINYQSFTAQNLIGAGRVAGNSDPHTRALLAFNKLPARENDMIYAVVVTRFGLLGGLAILGLYIAWIGGALLAAAQTKDPFGRLVIVGLAAFVAAQTVINIGMNLGLVPIIGITLPFLSAGGSSLLTVWMMTGLIFNISMRRPMPPYRQSFEYDDD
jgi:cell division protein FtsW (lipid II flippase)